MLKWNRRQFLSGLLTAASAGAANSAQALPVLSSPPSKTAHAASPATSVTPPGLAEQSSSDDSHGLRQLLPEGQHFGRWHVVSVLPVKLGAVPVLLESRRGERFQVDILRRDRSSRARRGLAETHEYSLFLLNRGQGDTPTQEDHGLAVLWLAALLRPRERTVATLALLTQRERTQRFPRGKFNALVATAAADQTRFEAPPSLSTQRVPTEPVAATMTPPEPPRRSGGEGSRPT